MKAIIWTKYGPPEVLKLGDVEKPVPKHNEVLIKINATTATAGDCELRSLSFPIWLSLIMRIVFGFRKPRKKIPGFYFAGEIESAGQDVKLFKKGVPVFGAAGTAAGAYAEYICLAEEGVLATKPANMTFEEAATVPIGGLEALHFLRKGNVRSGQTILINGHLKACRGDLDDVYKATPSPPFAFETLPLEATRSGRLQDAKRGGRVTGNIYHSEVSENKT